MERETAKVLIAEDESALGHIIRESLEERGFHVILCANGAIALEKVNTMKPDMVVLDIMMPKMDGLTVARKIRLTDQQLPILFLTAKTQTKDVITGFETGANDYLKKPFSIEELIVRIRVQLERRGFSEVRKSGDASIRLGDFSFYPVRHALHHGETIMKLTAKESAVLAFLCENQQMVAEKDAILRKIWGNNHAFNARSLDVFITKLRKHLAADPTIQIINVRGIGYKLVY